jgi:hypothetical protein
MTQELFLLGDISRKLKVPQHRIVYLFASQRVTEPKLTLGKRRVFTVEECRVIADKLGMVWDKP